MVFGLFGAKAKATPEIPVEEPLDSTTVAYVLCGTICAALRPPQRQFDVAELLGGLHCGDDRKTLPHDRLPFRLRQSAQFFRQSRLPRRWRVEVSARRVEGNNAQFRGEIDNSDVTAGDDE